MSDAQLAKNTQSEVDNHSKTEIQITCEERRKPAFFPVVSDVKRICLSGNDIYLRHEIRGLPYKQSSSNAGATLSAHTCKQGYPECFRNQHFDLNPNTDCMQT